MSSRIAPAAWPAALFLFGVALWPELAVAPGVGQSIAGIAAGLVLRTRWTLAFAALCAGFLLSALQIPEGLRGMDPGRVVEACGVVAGAGSFEDSEWHGLLRSETLRQGGRTEVARTPIHLQLASGVAPPAPGARICARGFLKRSAGFANERPTPPGRWRLRVKSPHFLRIHGEPSRFAQVAAAVRKRMEEPFAAHSGGHPGVAHARAMLFGDLSILSVREQRAFRRAGLAHLLAVSGMNVALAVACFAALGAHLGRRPRLALAAFAILLHLAAIGTAPSLLRASAMAALVLAALLLRRPPLPLQLLALSAALLVTLDPPLASDLGFRLSCFATLGLVTLAPWLAERSDVPLRVVRLGLATTVAAQIATLPLSAALFASFSPAALLFNLMFVPLASMLLVGAFAWCVWALAFPSLASGAALPLDALVQPFRGLAHLPAGTWLSLPTEGTLPAGIAATLGLCLLAALAMRVRRAWVGWLLLLQPLPPEVARPSAGEYELVAADVGQGDGLLLRRGSRAMMIDGGGVRGKDLAAQIWLPLLARRGLREIEVMVLSHGDSDHCGGLVDLAIHVRIGELVGPAVLAESDCVGELRFWSGAPFVAVAAGDRFEFAGARFEALSPGFEERPSTNNAASLVLHVRAAGRRILLTGDLDGPAEERLVTRMPSGLESDVLKVGHHGSAKGTSAALLGRVRPSLALISAGVENRFGHPAPAVLARLRKGSTTILRTDLQGQIVLRWREGGPIRLELPASPRAGA